MAASARFSISQGEHPDHRQRNQNGAIEGRLTVELPDKQRIVRYAACNNRNRDYHRRHGRKA